MLSPHIYVRDGNRVSQPCMPGLPRLFWATSARNGGGGACPRPPCRSGRSARRELACGPASGWVTALRPCRGRSSAGALPGQARSRHSSRTGGAPRPPARGRRPCGARPRAGVGRGRTARRASGMSRGGGRRPLRRRMCRGRGVRHMTHGAHVETGPPMGPLIYPLRPRRPPARAAPVAGDGRGRRRGSGTPGTVRYI